MSDDSLEQPPTIKPVPSIATDSAYPARIWPEYEVCPCCGTLLGEAVVRNTLFAATATVASLEAKLAEAERERDEARTLVTEANNSLYGSLGYFHSLNGGPFDRFHLAKGIEKLKSACRLAYEQQKRLCEALRKEGR